MEIAATQADLTAERLARTPHEPGEAAHRQAISAAAVATMTGWHTPAQTTVASTAAAPEFTGQAAIVRSWKGPWSLQNLTAALPATRHGDLARLLDPAGPGYARLVALAHAIDDIADIAVMRTRAIQATGPDISAGTAAAFVELMHAAGWVQRCPDS